MRIKIGDACEFINGGSWTQSDYRECGLPVLKVSNFNSSGFTINDISFLNSELGNKYEKNKLKINDIIIATVGSHPSLVNSAAGRTIRVNSNVVNYYLNQNAICLRVNDDKNINQIYLYYLTETTAFRNFIQQMGKGAANQMRIPISGIKDFSWDFPPLETQKKIASILSGYDDLIENNLKRIKILEEMAQQTYEEWFVRMRFPGHDASSASASVNEETSETERSRSLPEGWEKVKLGDEFIIKNGKSFKGVNSENPYDNKIYGSNGIIGYSNLSNTRNSIIIGRVGAYCGSINYCSQDYWATDNTIFVEEKNNSISIELAYFILKQLNLRTYAGGAAQPLLTQNTINQLEIIKPSKDLIFEFSEKCKNINKQILNLQNQNQRLREARDILLPRLMMGMIEV